MCRCSARNASDDLDDAVDTLHDAPACDCSGRDSVRAGDCGRGGAIRVVVGSGTSGAGETSSSRLVPRGGSRLVPTKPKPLLKEAAIDLTIMGAAQLFFRGRALHKRENV